MLTKHDEKIIEGIITKIVTESLTNLVPRIVAKQIEDTVPNIVEKQIEEKVPGIIQTKISEAFDDFYENIFEPFANKTEKKFEQNFQHYLEIKEKFKENHQEHILMQEKIEAIEEYIKDHEKRIKRLEVTNQLA